MVLETLSVIMEGVTEGIQSLFNLRKEGSSCVNLRPIGWIDAEGEIQRWQPQQ